MMSSEETSSPVSASTFMYLMRWPVLRLIWLKLIFSESEVAGNKATGQVTRERRKKPFQLARERSAASSTEREYSLSSVVATGRDWSSFIALMITGSSPLLAGYPHGWNSMAGVVATCRSSG